MGCMKATVLAGVVTLAASAVTAATLVDIDARTNTTTNPVNVLLDAGTYDVTPTDTGAFLAWSPWALNSGCDQDGGGCTNGWIFNYSYRIDFDPSEQTTVGGAGIWATPELAFATGFPIELTLPVQQTVSFFVSDSQYTDNRGGISLLITPRNGEPSIIPLPATLPLLLGAGLMLLGLGRFRRA